MTEYQNSLFNSSIGQWFAPQRGDFSALLGGPVINGHDTDPEISHAAGPKGKPQEGAKRKKVRVKLCRHAAGPVWLCLSEVRAHPELLAYWYKQLFKDSRDRWG